MIHGLTGVTSAFAVGCLGALGSVIARTLGARPVLWVTLMWWAGLW